MIPFIVLFMFTSIAGTVLYFYPPNIPLKFKMTLLGLAFLLALGGLFILGNLSYGLALAAILAIAFVASYVAEKRMNLVPGTAGQTEIVLSSSDKEEATEAGANGEHLNVESAVTLEEIPDLEELAEQEVVLNNTYEEPISEVPNYDSLNVIDLLDMELEEIEERNIEIESIDPIQEFDATDKMAELTDEEFSFLTETREISAEEVTNLPVYTDIEDVDIFLQRSVLLEELDEEETLEELPQEEEVVLLEEFVELADEVPNTDEKEEVHISTLSDPSFKEEFETAEEIFTETEELPFTEEVHLTEEPIILEEILVKNPEHVDTTPDQIEASVEEIEEAEKTTVAEFLEVAEQEEEAGDPVAEGFETEPEIPVVEEIKVEPAIPNMNAEVQDMLLNTLFSYQEQGDNESYQLMAETVLNQSLSDKDYYLFGKLLLDSYAASSETPRMKTLLEAMKLRLQSYPVIAEELERYKEIFPVKQ